MSDVFTVRAWRHQIQALSSFVVESPNAPQAVRELAGAFNAAMAEAENPPAVPTPTPGDPLARIRAAPSQWAKLWFADDAEWQALIDRGFMTQDHSNVLKNWWKDYGVKGFRSGTGYVYADYSTGAEVKHVDKGGADAATEAVSGRRIPGPLI